MPYVFSNNDLREIYQELVAGGTSSATAANQVLEISQLTDLNTKDFATQTTLAAVLAKIIAAPATEAKQDTGNTSLATIAGKDFATQTTLAAILAKIIAAPATEAKQDTGNTSLSNIDGKLYAPKGNEVTGYVDSITNTAPQDIIAAQGASNYTYISAILVTNSHATVGTIVHIIDDTSAVLFSGYAAPINGGFTVSFPTPIRTSATNKKVQAICLTTGASVTVSVTGFKGT